MPNIREQIKALVSAPKLDPIKFGGVECFVKRWSERDRIEWSIELQTSTTKVEFEGDDGKKSSFDGYLKCKAIARSLCDADGNLVFESFAEVADYDTEILDPVFEAVMKLQEIGGDDAKKN